MAKKNRKRDFVGNVDAKLEDLQEDKDLKGGKLAFSSIKAKNISNEKIAKESNSVVDLFTNVSQSNNDVDEAVKASDDIVDEVKAETEFENTVATTIKDNVQKEDEVPPIVTEDDGDVVINGASISKLAKEGQGGSEFTDEEYNKIDAQNELFKDGGGGLLANGVMEKLTSADYYPPGGGIVKSSFTGRYIGSRELVSNGGALIPFGVHDARLRAKQEKEKEKNKAISTILSIGNTSPQYDVKYGDAYVEMTNKYLEAVDGDAEALLSGRNAISREYLRENEKFKRKGKAISHLVTTSEALMKKMETESFIPNDVIREAKSVIVDLDVDKYLSDESYASNVDKTLSNLNSYQSFTDVAETSIAEYNDNPDMVIGNSKGFKNADDIANFTSGINSKKNSGYDIYTTFAKKYVDIDAIETTVKTLYAENNLYTGLSGEKLKAKIESGVRYMVNRIATQIIETTKSASNTDNAWINAQSKGSLQKTENQKAYQIMLDEVNALDRESLDKIMLGGGAYTVSNGVLAMSKPVEYINVNFSDANSNNNVKIIIEGKPFTVKEASNYIAKVEPKTSGASKGLYVFNGQRFTEDEWSVLANKFKKITGSGAIDVKIGSGGYKPMLFHEGKLNRYTKNGKGELKWRTQHTGNIVYSTEVSGTKGADASFQKKLLEALPAVIIGAASNSSATSLDSYVQKSPIELQ